MYALYSNESLHFKDVYVLKAPREEDDDECLPCINEQNFYRKIYRLLRRIDLQIEMRDENTHTHTHKKVMWRKFEISDIIYLPFSPESLIKLKATKKSATTKKKVQQHNVSRIKNVYFIGDCGLIVRCKLKSYGSRSTSFFIVHIWVTRFFSKLFLGRTFYIFRTISTREQKHQPKKIVMSKRMTKFGCMRGCCKHFLCDCSFKWDDDDDESNISDTHWRINKTLSL